LSASAREEITTSARLLNVPPIPDVPELLRGAPDGRQGRARALDRRPRVLELHRARRAGRVGFFEPEVYARLQRVKADYDADDLFRGNHPIPPARG
jgi:Berberine and berberine like